MRCCSNEPQYYSNKVGEEVTTRNCLEQLLAYLRSNVEVSTHLKYLCSVLCIFIAKTTVFTSGRSECLAGYSKSSKCDQRRGQSIRILVTNTVNLVVKVAIQYVL